MKDGWRMVRLGDICRLLNGRAYSKKELLAKGKYTVLRVGNFFSNQSWYYSDLELEEDKYCDTGDLLYAWSASFGPRIWDGGKVIYHYHIWRVDPDPDVVDKRFLFHWFEWDKEKIKAEQGAGTTMTHVTKGAMEDRALVLPPLAEQKRIVAILDEAFAAIATATANTQQNLANARHLFDSHLNQIFTQKGPDWEEKRLTELTSKVTVGHVGSMASEYRDEGVPFLRSQNITPFKVDLANVKFIGAEFHAALLKSRLRPGDLAIVRTGYPGTAAVIPESLADCNCSDLVIVRPAAGTNPHYLACFFNSSYGKALVGLNLVGAAQKHFNITAAKEVPIPFPSLAEQDDIVERMNAVATETQSLAALYQRKLDCLAELKQSLLQRAFAGELTATPDLAEATA